MVAEFGRGIGADVEIDAVDFQTSTIAIARQLSEGFPEISYHDADIQHVGKEGAYGRGGRLLKRDL